MNHRLLFNIIQLAVLFLTFVCFSEVNAQNSKFTVVIDAGHGGHDPGAIGKISREKDINLAVSLNLGEIIAANYNDVKVVYTRNTDRYLTLQERADIVNANHADLFICVHTNSAQSSSAYGSESFTLGLAKSKGNLDVAMKENAVILMEDDYKSKYKGFDPTSVDSYIMFEFMQDKYIDRSISFASDIQGQFKNYAGRSDRGVRQAGFWVLFKSACPSVLVELGFISNPPEEKYLASSSGQKQMAESIFNAFKNFKYEYDKKAGKTTKKQNYVSVEDVKVEEVGRNDKKSDEVEAPIKSKVANTKEAVLSQKEKNRLQAKADSIKKAEEKQAEIKLKEEQKLAEQAKNTIAENQKPVVKESTVKKEKPTEETPKQKAIVENKSNTENVVEKPKATQETKSAEEVVSAAMHDNVKTEQSSAQKTGAKNIEKDKYVDLKAYEAAIERPVYKLQLFASPRKLNSNAADFRGIRNADFFVENGMYKYTLGADTNYDVISKLRKEMLSIFPDAFVVAFIGKKKISINEAIKLTNKNK